MEKFTKEEFIKKANKVHHFKYDYSKVEYKNARTKVKIICPYHGVFEQVSRAHLAGRGCKQCYLDKKHQRKLFTENQKNTLKKENIEKDLLLRRDNFI